MSFNHFFDHRNPKHTHEVLTLTQVSTHIQAVNPKFWEILQSIPEWETMPVLLARYPYGAKLSEQGQFQLNFLGTPTPIKDARIPPLIKTLFQYPWEGIPTGMVLSHMIESVIESDPDAPPTTRAHHHPGDVFSIATLFEPVLNAKPQGLHTIYSGHRNLISLTPLNDMQFGLRLATYYGFRPCYPKNLSAQHTLWQSIGTHAEHTEHWYSTCLFFSAKLIDRLRHTPNALLYSLKQEQERTTFLRHQELYQRLWHDFIDQTLKPTHPNLRIAEVTYTLLMAAVGETPGFAPATQDLAGPIAEITTALAEHYKLRYHFPILMQSQFYQNKTPLYLSLQYPICSQNPLFSSGPQQTLIELHEIKKLLEKFLSLCLSPRKSNPFDKTLFQEKLAQTQWDFYHPHAEDNAEISSDLEALFEEDTRFQGAEALYPDRGLSYPTRSVFLYGVIRVKPKSESHSKR